MKNEHLQALSYTTILKPQLTFWVSRAWTTWLATWNKKIQKYVIMCVYG